jgi:hypothetical protein
MASLEGNVWDKYDSVSGAKNRNKILIQKALGVCLPISVFLAFAAFWISGLILLWHLIGFPQCRWLKPEEITHLQNLLFSSFVGAAVAGGTKHFLLDDKAPR